MSRADYSLYILRCSDGSLYTGISRDVARRLEQHKRGSRGAKYLRGRTPFELVYTQPAGDRGAAQRLEYRVKRLSHAEKCALIAAQIQAVELQ